MGPFLFPAIYFQQIKDKGVNLSKKDIARIANEALRKVMISESTRSTYNTINKIAHMVMNDNNMMRDYVEDMGNGYLYVELPGVEIQIDVDENQAKIAGVDMEMVMSNKEFLQAFEAGRRFMELFIKTFGEQ